MELIVLLLVYIEFNLLTLEGNQKVERNELFLSQIVLVFIQLDQR